MSNTDPASHIDESVGNREDDKWDRMVIYPVVKRVMGREGEELK